MFACGSQVQDMATLSALPASGTLSLLLIDDDRELCGMMQEFFAENGHRLTVAYDGRNGLAQALGGQYDLIILDVMLPQINGFTLLHQIRRHSAVPVIMLTARSHRSDRIEGLDKGADDYLAKPFDPDELLSRIRAVFRRIGSSQHLQDSVTRFGEIRIDVSRREVWKGRRLVELTAMEFDIFDLLARSAGRIVSRDEITEALFERKATHSDRSLDVHISRLRKKLESGHTLIRTIRGVGYVFTSAER
jgi:DNA-binding response OmpR family regulator